jgi:hypothetical protein
MAQEDPSESMKALLKKAGQEAAYIESTLYYKRKYSWEWQNYLPDYDYDDPMLFDDFTR